MIRNLIAPLLLTALLFALPAHAEVPQVGDMLPPFSIPSMALDEDAAALGLDTNRDFTLEDIKTPYIMIEIIGVYCAICHEQAPSLAKLYKRLKKTKLDQKITILGIAAGGTPMEVKYVRQKEYAFPVAHDPEFAIYNKLAEPKTPFTLIVDKQGKVLYAHRGIIPDINALFKEIQTMVQ